MIDNIPSHAKRITYGINRKDRVYIYVWDTYSHVGGSTVTSYVWSALGQSGEERSFELAVQAARNYVQFGPSQSKQPIERIEE